MYPKITILWYYNYVTVSSSKYKPVVVYILCGVHIQTFALMLYDLEGISSRYSMWCVVSGRVVYYMTILFYYDLCSGVHYYWNVLPNEQLRVKSVGSTLPIPNHGGLCFFQSLLQIHNKLLKRSSLFLCSHHDLPSYQLWKGSP